MLLASCRDAPSADPRTPIGVRRDAVIDYPTATWSASPNFTPLRTSYDFVVLHVMQGNFTGTRQWYESPSSKASAHYLVESQSGAVTQMVEDKDTALHADCLNDRSLGIDHEGFMNDPKYWFTDAMYVESAKLTRWLTQRHVIPRDRDHVIGHSEVEPACNPTNATDPGPGWNWTKYMQLVRNEVPSASVGVLHGQVTQAVTGEPIVGALVTFSSQTYVTDSNGLYSGGVGPGTYSASVSAPGMQTASFTRTITSGNRVWGSVALSAVSPAGGTIRGLVHLYNSAAPTDTSQTVAGATTTIAGTMVTSDATGRFEVAAAPGVHTFVVNHAGHENFNVGVAVSPGEIVDVAIPLVATGAADVLGPRVRLTQPVATAVSTSLLTVEGLVMDDRGAVAMVSVSLNGGAPLDVPIANGAFSAELTLRGGVNQIAARVVDSTGNETIERATVTFAQGVGGVVRVFRQPKTPIAGAVVELKDVSGANVLASTMSAADGRYVLPAMGAPKDFRLDVRAPGHVGFDQTVSVPADRLLTVDLGLVPGLPVTPVKGITFVDPLDGASVTTDTVTVYGRVQGFEVASVKVNGAAGEVLGGGGFAATVSLVAGENLITVTAVGTAGETATGRMTIHADLARPAPTAVIGVCSTTPGLGAVLWLLGLPALRRLRRNSRGRVGAPRSRRRQRRI
jgi:N-acetyl-anhydromuramyl-L-alanine amidase AmpD